jgi:hypothetical protein
MSFGDDTLDPTNRPAPNPYEEKPKTREVFKNLAVHSPAHYTGGGIEVIDFIEAKGLGFHLGNTVKYVSRAGLKQDAKIQDLEKAMWYLIREINRLDPDYVHITTKEKKSVVSR